MTQSSELESDLSIQHLVQYQQMLEHVLEVYREERKTPSRLHLQTKQMSQNLEFWWMTLPQHMRSTCKLSFEGNKILTNRLKASSSLDIIT